MTRGIERTFPSPFSETFRISKNEDFNGPYLENENEFLKNSLETVFRASKSCDRDQLVSAFHLTFKSHLYSVKNFEELLHPSHTVIQYTRKVSTLSCSARKRSSHDTPRTDNSYKRVLNLLNNDICIAEIGQAVLELLQSKFGTGNPHRSRKLSFSDFSKSPLVPKMT